MSEGGSRRRTFRSLPGTEQGSAPGHEHLGEAAPYTHGILTVPPHPGSNHPITRRREDDAVNGQPVSEELSSNQGNGEGEGVTHGPLGLEDGIRCRIHPDAAEVMGRPGGADQDADALPRRREPAFRLEQLPVGLDTRVRPERLDPGPRPGGGRITQNLPGTGGHGLQPGVVRPEERSGAEVRRTNLRPRFQAAQGPFGMEQNIPAIPDADGPLDEIPVSVAGEATRRGDHTGHRTVQHAVQGHWSPTAIESGGPRELVTLDEVEGQWGEHSSRELPFAGPGQVHEETPYQFDWRPSTIRWTIRSSAWNFAVSSSSLPSRNWPSVRSEPSSQRMMFRSTSRICTAVTRVTSR